MTENSFQIAQLYGLTAFPALMIAAALCDLTTYRIPNKLSAALALAFVPAVFLAPLSGSEIGFHVAVGVAALGLGIAALAVRRRKQVAVPPPWAVQV